MAHFTFAFLCLSLFASLLHCESSSFMFTFLIWPLRHAFGRLGSRCIQRLQARILPTSPQANSQHTYTHTAKSGPDNGLSTPLFKSRYCISRKCTPLSHGYFESQGITLRVAFGVAGSEAYSSRRTQSQWKSPWWRRT